MKWIKAIILFHWALEKIVIYIYLCVLLYIYTFIYIYMHIYIHVCVCVYAGDPNRLGLCGPLPVEIQEPSLVDHICKSDGNSTRECEQNHQLMSCCLIDSHEHSYFQPTPSDEDSTKLQ